MYGACVPERTAEGESSQRYEISGPLSHEALTIHVHAVEHVAELRTNLGLPIINMTFGTSGGGR